MFPVLFKIGPITIYTYGFLLALGVLSAIVLSLKFAKIENLDKKIVSDFIFYTLIFGLLGAKVFLFFSEFKYYSKSFSSFKTLLTSGGTFFGGLIFGVLFAAFYIRRKKIKFRQVADVVAPGVALAHFFGRLGCFAAGCCFGRFAGEDCSIAVKFVSTKGHTGVPINSPIYPTQLMEAILNLLNFVILFTFFKKKRFTGQVFVLYILNYSIIRFVVEYFRGDLDRGYIFGSVKNTFTSLSVPQLISIIGILFSLVLYKFFQKTAKGAENHNN